MTNYTLQDCEKIVIDAIKECAHESAKMIIANEFYAMTDTRFLSQILFEEGQNYDSEKKLVTKLFDTFNVSLVQNNFILVLKAIWELKYSGITLGDLVLFFHKNQNKSITITPYHKICELKEDFSYDKLGNIVPHDYKKGEKFFRISHFYYYEYRSFKDDYPIRNYYLGVGNKFNFIINDDNFEVIGEAKNQRMALVEHGYITKY